MKKAQLKNMWVPVSSLGRSQWMNVAQIRHTRRKCKADYLLGVPKEDHKWFLKNVRFVKINITEV